MRTLTETSRIRVGLMGILVVLLVVGVGQSFASVPMLNAQPIYYAQFADTAGLSTGDKVRIAGVDVGRVRSIQIDGDSVSIGYTLGGTRIGRDSTAAIRTDTLLGRRNIEITPNGSEVLRPGGVLPVGQTTTPYQIYDVFSDATTAVSGWDTQMVKRSMNVLSETVDQISPHLSAALKGMGRFSDIIGKRDEQINQLLANANAIAGVLGDRSEQVNALLVNARTLLAAVNERGKAISLLLERVSAVSEQIKGFINDNPNLNKVLEQLRIVSDILVERKHELNETLVLIGKYQPALGEVGASGPYLKGVISNLVPPQILQPFIDAAFKDRGIDPQKFWSDAGLPAFQFPDPNGSRFANGAPPPAPTPLEGTPEHPGPAVPPGSPCSYVPGPDALPTPENPLPCAHATVGPFGDNPHGTNYGPPDVATSAPNPGGPPPAPGVSSSAIPGQVAPVAPGAPVPIAPDPPGARRDPPGPFPVATPPDNPPFLQPESQER
ncbi:MCE family protein [Mycobacterium sp. IS-3022]|uniref:MCE family protein n=1 Tax=Mycobacterium sp. IS-3022 TaxID=1772277 RepID=UPI000741789D|nr:MCE family protein [Mycobacterium sp. IS-3022]KUI01828.1 mammalian cell entry protein [Mycobacterium sp. IS-3022]